MSGPILVTGGSGQIGIELRRRSDAVVTPTRKEMDLANPVSLAEMIASRPWTAVINTAAYTGVDKAENNVATAWSVNAVGPAVIAAETARLNIPLLHVSTDYVFAGDKATPYLPGDATGPLGVYGASKLGGEIAVRSVNPVHAILRTAWVVSPHGGNFLKTMLRLGTECETLAVVADQHGNPTGAGDIADALLTMAARMTAPSAPTGTFHFVNAGEATWHSFAEAIFAAAAWRGQRVPQVTATAAADFPVAARRPAYSRLDTRSLQAAFGIVPRRWQDAMNDILGELLDRGVPNGLRGNA